MGLSLGDTSGTAASGEHILDYSSRIIDSGVADGPVNRVTNELSELTDDVALIESFSHVVAVRTDDGLVAFDTSGVFTAQAVTASLRSWSADPLHTIVYTHGHADHVGGSGVLIADNRERGFRDPRVIGHEAVADRFARYRETNGWNLAINARQFGGVSPKLGLGVGGDRHFLPENTALPTDTYRTAMSASVGGTTFELFHDRGETDDHTWAWFPDQKMLCVGDLLIWVFPNAGNPQKVQRYPGEWAAALRKMAAMGAELLVPAHGLPIVGNARISAVLGEVAAVLESLVVAVVDRMNAGYTLDEIVAEVSVDDAVLSRPWLTPTYDEPEFVVRNIWRAYGGWWDANPAHLKPAPAARLGAEVASLAGGADRLSARAAELAAAGDFRLACELIEWAAQADPSPAIHGMRAEIYKARRSAESSLMAKGIFSAAVAESVAQLEARPEA